LATLVKRTETRRIDMQGRTLLGGLQEVLDKQPKSDRLYSWMPEVHTDINSVGISGSRNDSRLELELEIPFRLGTYVPGQLAAGLSQLSQIDPALLNNIEVRINRYLKVDYRRKVASDAIGTSHMSYWGWCGNRVMLPGQGKETKETYSLRRALQSMGLNSSESAVNALQRDIIREAKLRGVPVDTANDCIMFGNGIEHVGQGLLEKEMQQRPLELTLSSGRSHLFLGPVKIKQNSLSISIGYSPLDGIPGNKYDVLVNWLTRNQPRLSDAVLTATGISLNTELQSPWVVTYKRVPLFQPD